MRASVLLVRLRTFCVHERVLGSHAIMAHQLYNLTGAPERGVWYDFGVDRHRSDSVSYILRELLIQCSVRCGIGTKTRVIKCMAESEDECSGVTRPPTETTCDMGPCSSRSPAHWLTTEWSSQVHRVYNGLLILS